MPQTSPERRERWPGWDKEAITFLEEKEWKLTRDWLWIPPHQNYMVSEQEADALIYLMEEWDFGGLAEGQVVDFSQVPEPTD